MAYYLLQASYTPEGWAAQIKQPQDVRQRVQVALTKVGGNIVGVWYAFGEWDVVAILEYPSNVNAAAYAVAIMPSGAIKDLRITPLLTVEEGMAAMQQAAEVGAVYRPPGQ
jgi:uncharacterized protein with GYD domain